ncbi:uncharacterized protein AB675_4617 [Cyphellophora attinorum]|uniref:Uncharacterized protein n=1 Tax=Cyphellophora attinorum TaxID=1664694 RepID=A0A0N1H7W8_9EURO|nr:uncharacterized protein AB675_4617 [Phialophora attinorum]KPI38947.1 hypothetical protein AB675_4617 [Phialophora attinorum]
MAEKVSWSPDKTVFFLDGRAIGTCRLQEMMQRMVQDATGIVHKLFGEQTAWVWECLDPQQLYDRITWRKTGSDWTDLPAMALSIPYEVIISGSRSCGQMKLLHTTFNYQGQSILGSDLRFTRIVAYRNEPNNTNVQEQRQLRHITQFQVATIVGPRNADVKYFATAFTVDSESTSPRITLEQYRRRRIQGAVKRLMLSVRHSSIF